MNGIALKGKRSPFRSRMMQGWTGDRLFWMMENGLAWRGQMPPGWFPRPRTLKAAFFLVFRMVPRGL